MDDKNKNQEIMDDGVTESEVKSDVIQKEVLRGETNKEIKLHTVVENLGLETVHQSSNYYDITLSSADVNRPGLQLAGYLEDFPYLRLQIIGSVEYTYLTGLDSKLQYERFRGYYLIISQPLYSLIMQN